MEYILLCCALVWRVLKAIQISDVAPPTVLRAALKAVPFYIYLASQYFIVLLTRYTS